MDGVKVALSNRGMTVEAARVENITILLSYSDIISRVCGR